MCEDMIIDELEVAEKKKTSTEWEPKFDAVMRRYYGKAPIEDILAYFERQGKNYPKAYLHKKAWSLGVSKKRGNPDA